MNIPIVGPLRSNVNSQAVTETIKLPQAVEEPLSRILKNLEEKVTRLPPNPVNANRPHQRNHDASYARRPPGSLNQMQCYNCQGYGHISRHCPNRQQDQVLSPPQYVTPNVNQPPPVLNTTVENRHPEN